jgi:CheY-like chemotaxis protein
MKKADASMPQILIADDQADVREALKLLFKGEGYRTEVAANPARVLELVGEQDFSLLLMDLNYARDTTSGEEGLDLLNRASSSGSVPQGRTAWMCASFRRRTLI